MWRFIIWIVVKAFIILVSISIFCKSIEVFYASHTLCSYHHHQPENKKIHKLRPVRPVWVMVQGVNKPFVLSELPFPTESHRHLFSWRLAQDQDYIFYFFNANLSIYLSIYIFFYFMLFHVSLRKWWACFLSWQCTCWREFCSLCHGFPSMEFHRKSIFTEEEWLALFWLDSLKSLLGSLGEMQTLL